MRRRRYSSLSKAENDLLSEEQKAKLARFDNDVKDSNNRWNKRIARRLHDGEEPVDCVDFMAQPMGTRLHWWAEFGADDYGEESSP